MRYVLIFLSAFLAPLIALSTALYAFDPLELFHKPWGRQAAYTKQMQFQAAGLLRTHYYDGVILGTSMLANTSAKEASETLEGRFLNISLSGGFYSERAVLLGFALEHRPVRRVIYSLDWILVGPAEKNLRRPWEEWSYLYNEPFPLRVYFDPLYLRCLPLWKVANCIKGFSVTDANDIPAWKDVWSSKRFFGGFDNWTRYRGRLIDDAFERVLNDTKAQPKAFDAEAARAKFETIKLTLDADVLPFAREYRDTQFSLIVPPYFRYGYSHWLRKDPTSFQGYLLWLRYLATLSEKYSNVAVYAFGDMDYSDKIENYKDLDHYSYEMNSYMLRSIESGAHLLNRDSIDAYIETFKRKAEEFPLEAFQNQVADAAAHRPISLKSN
jgi:hypothetical protein